MGISTTRRGPSRRTRSSAGARLVRALAALAGLVGAGGVVAGEVTIRRDTWGVPHVFADTLADGAFGLGYAQAEDRLAQIDLNYRQAIGRLAEVQGPGAVEGDWRHVLAGQESVCRRRYGELPAEVRALCEAYQEGVRAYAAAHPEKRPADALTPEPWMVPAVLRMVILNWPVGQAMHELGFRDRARPYSNTWAVRPGRTADGAAILLIDPHVGFDGPFRFYEFRLHAGGHDISGFGPVGTPFLGLGHNAFLGWACTTGGPDTTDIYAEQVDPSDPGRYRYDGGWRTFTRETVTIPVKGAKPVVRTLERSHHGPIALREGNTAYAIACPYLGEIDLATQFYRMMTARDLAAFDAALGMNELMEQNVMYADVAGNIRYVRTGRVPVRPPGFDFGRPVPGDTSRSEWKGIHPLKDLVQVLNPPTGYLQNCNVSPDTMARGLKLDPAAYPPYLFHSYPNVANSRGRRAVELLERHDRLTVEQATAIALDTHADRCELWQAALREAAGRADLTRPRLGTDPAALKKAVDAILAWDGRMDQDSTAATRYRAWRMVAQDRKLPELDGTGRAKVSDDALLDSLAEATARMVSLFGGDEVPYGRVHRIRRGGRSWPVSGGDSGGGQTLRAVGSSLEGNVFYGNNGQTWTQLVQFRPGAVRSWSANTYGESDDPASPHFSDQAEKLYSRSRLKPTWFQPAELDGNVESSVVLKH